jgi:hypothetical protein
VVFLKRVQAIEQYVQGKGGRHIEEESGVALRTVYRMIERALRIHPDGRAWGYRALIPHERVKPYERTRPVRRLAGTNAGNTGAFQQLLGRFEILQNLLRDAIRDRDVLLEQVGDRMRLRGLKRLLANTGSGCRSARRHGPNLACIAGGTGENSMALVFDRGADEAKGRLLPRWPDRRSAISLARAPVVLKFDDNRQYYYAGASCNQWDAVLVRRSGLG